MINSPHRIVCGHENLGADRSAKLFSQMFITEAMAARKPSWNEIVVDPVDVAIVTRAVSGLPEAHECSAGDYVIVALDAASAIAFANYRMNIVVSYDLFDDVEHLAQRTGASADLLRSRLHTALCRADKLVLIGGKASRMAWMYFSRDAVTQLSPPVSAYSNPMRDMALPMLIIVHEPGSDAAAESAAQLHASYPSSIVVDSAEPGTDRDGQGIPSEIALAVHIGSDVRARPGFRIVDAWASEIPVVQLISSSTDVVDAEGGGAAPCIVAHQETGLLATNSAELRKHVTTILTDPILASVLTRRSKEEVAKQGHIWRDIVHGVFS